MALKAQDTTSERGNYLSKGATLPGTFLATTYNMLLVDGDKEYCALTDYWEAIKSQCIIATFRRTQITFVPMDFREVHNVLQFIYNPAI
jgi:hypothetical protein